MRIISGKYKGRRFQAPEEIPTRPMTNIAKEGLFNILNNNINFDEVKFLELFGGTGNISYEMASRGCTDITVVERFPLCAEFIESMIDKLEIEGMKVLQADVFDVINNATQQYDLIFAGPPYGLDLLDELPDRIFGANLLTEGGILVLEHNPKHNFDNHKEFAERRTYGQTHLSFFLN